MIDQGDTFTISFEELPISIRGHHVGMFAGEAAVTLGVGNGASIEINLHADDDKWLFLSAQSTNIVERWLAQSIIGSFRLQYARHVDEAVEMLRYRLDQQEQYPAGKPASGAYMSGF